MSEMAIVNPYSSWRGRVLTLAKKLNESNPEEFLNLPANDPQGAKRKFNALMAFIDTDNVVSILRTVKERGYDTVGTAQNTLNEAFSNFWGEISGWREISSKNKRTGISTKKKAPIKTCEYYTQAYKHLDPQSKYEYSHLGDKDFLTALYPTMFKKLKELADKYDYQMQHLTEDLFGSQLLPAVTPSPVTPSPAPAPTTPSTKRVKFLQELDPVAHAGDEFDVQEEEPDGVHILITTPSAASAPMFLPMADKGVIWDFVETAVAPVTPPEPAPAVPTPTPTPSTPGDPREPWQLVETTRFAYDRRVALFQNNLPLLSGIKKLPAVFKAIRENFVWNSEGDEDSDIDAKIFASIFLIKNGSLILKGVPGTGKTQLIEMATMLFANDVLDVPTEELWFGEERFALEKRANLVDWLISRGIVGAAKHNADKEIQDIFFYTEIALERYLPQAAVAKIAAPTGGVIKSTVEPSKPEPKAEPTKITPPTILTPSGEGGSSALEGTTSLAKVASAIPGASGENIFENPPPAGFDRKPSEYQQYEFRPKPRPVVFSVIKFHNEANRMNADVADTILGLLAENEVEFQGKRFYSPAAWNPQTKELIFDSPEKDFGHLNFFDYNPHLEVEDPGMELDRALLDRVTAGMFLSGGSPSTRFSVLESKTFDGSREPRDVIFGLIAEKKIAPITRAELKGLWSILPEIPVDAEVLSWIAYLTNIPNISVRGYGTAYKSKDRDFVGSPIDRTVVVFKDALRNLNFTTNVGEVGAELTTNPIAGLSQLERPLGVRSAEALLRLYKAYTLLRAVIEEGKQPWDVKIYIDSPAQREKVFNDLCDLLPYVLDHRLNLGIESQAKQQFLSAFDMIKYYFVPYLKSEVEDGTTANDQKRKQRLFAFMEGLMAVYVENQKKIKSGKKKMSLTQRKAKAEAVIKSKLGIRDAELAAMIKGEESDPFITSMYSLIFGV